MSLSAILSLDYRSVYSDSLRRLGHIAFVLMMGTHEAHVPNLSMFLSHNSYGPFSSGFIPTYNVVI